MIHHCGRANEHDRHDWVSRPLGVDWPRVTYTCTGRLVTEGGWTRCPGCGTSGRPHYVGGEECREWAREKAISQGDR